MSKYIHKYFKVRGFSYLTGGQGEPKANEQQSNGRLSNGTSNGSSNGLAKSNSYGGEGNRGGSTGRLGEYIRRQQDMSSKEVSGNSLMSEFMNVRDTKFTSLSPAVKPR